MVKKTLSSCNKIAQRILLIMSFINFNQQLPDGLKIKIDNPFLEDKIKSACKFYFLTENKKCHFVNNEFDILVDGYPTRKSLLGNHSFLTTEQTNRYFLSYQNDFITFVSTDDYSYPEVEEIYIPASLQKIEKAIECGITKINIYDINVNSINFCINIIEGNLEKVIETFEKFKERSSPISLSLEEKYNIIMNSYQRLRGFSNVSVNTLNIDIIKNPLLTNSLVDVSNIFIFPRNTWMYTNTELTQSFNNIKNFIGWTPEFKLCTKPFS